MDTSERIERLKDRLNRELARLAALRHKSRRLEIEHNRCKEREARAQRVVEGLLERQQEISTVLDRADAMLRRNQDILARVGPQMTEMVESLPEQEREAWLERLTRIREQAHAQLGAPGPIADEPAQPPSDLGEPDVIDAEAESMDTRPRPGFGAEELELAPFAADPLADLDTDFVLATSPCEQVNPSLVLDCDVPTSVDAAQPDIFSYTEPRPAPDGGFQLQIVPDEHPLTRLDDSFSLVRPPTGPQFRNLALDFGAPQSALVGQLAIFVDPHLLPVLDSNYALALVPDADPLANLDSSFALQMVPEHDDGLTLDLVWPSTLPPAGQIELFTGRGLLPLLDSEFSLSTPRLGTGPVVEDTLVLVSPPSVVRNYTLDLNYPVQTLDHRGQFELDWEAVVEEAVGPVPQRPATQTCPRCGRPNRLDYAACRCCYAPLGASSTSVCRGLISLLRATLRRR